MAITQALGDITELDVDAIVNAANSNLLAGGGVCGAIYRAAGMTALQDDVEANYPEGCPTGSAVITGGHALKARHVIHAVGPRWHGGEMGEPDLLASAYRSALELAAQHELTSIAFPSISTGIYGYPMELASEIAVREARAFGESHPEIEIIFCSYNAEAFELYKRLING